MMSKHKYYDMIVAKAGDTELSVLLRVNGGAWREYECGGFPAFSNGDYFLCLPKHKDAVLNILNGGKSQVRYFDIWSECNCNDPLEWNHNWWYMADGCESRIKPRKEKRFALVGNDFRMGVMTFNSKKELEQYYAKDISNGQIVEFDVEV